MFSNIDQSKLILLFVFSVLSISAFIVGVFGFGNIIFGFVFSITLFSLLISINKCKRK